MKRIAFVGLSAILLSGAATVASAQSDSLGDYARSIRKEGAPPVAKKYDNDNLPMNDGLSVVGQPSASSDNPADSTPAASAEAAKQPDTKQADAKSTAPSSSQSQVKANGDWKGKISGQKDQVDLLTRELDVVQRESRLRAAAFYADAGNRLRDSGDWDKQQNQTQQQIDQKQKALEDAKQKLEDMQEEARKAGVSSSDRE